MSTHETWELYRQALDASIDGMALLDAAGRYVYANAAHAAAYGFAHAEDLIGQSWRILYDDKQLHFIDEQVFPILQSQGHWQGEAVGRRRDGSVFPQELSLASLPDGGLVCVVRDISDRVLAEQAQLLYLLLSENTHDIILFIAPNGSIREANTAACTAYGYTHDELLRLGIKDLRAPEARATIPTQFAQVAKGPIVFETTQMRKDGSAFPVEVSSHSADYNGEQVIISVIRDVTERQAHEAEIAQLGRAVDESSDEIYVVDGDTLSFMQANLRATQNLGYSLDELQQMKPVDVAPEMTAQRLAEALELVRAGIRSTAMLRTTAQRRDGTTYPVEARLSLAETGGRTAIVVIFTDISERLAAEAEHTLILTAMDQVSEGIVILDEDERLQYANQGLEHILGVPAASILGKTLAEFPAGPGFEELHQRAGAAMLSGQPWTGMLIMTRSDGTPLTLRVTVRAIRQPEGQTRGYCVIIHDATEEAHREEELRQSQKMEAVGLLAGGIAHD
ncbi:PAS domain S-box protein, partial [Candidatus Cryosericum hinesii]